MELIDKQKAKQALVDLPPELDAFTVQKAIEAIARVKTEDALPIVHGKWEKVKPIHYKCSVCGIHVGGFISNYCFYCGAKMDVENYVDNVEKG